MLQKGVIKKVDKGTAHWRVIYLTTARSSQYNVFVLTNDIIEYDSV